VRNREGTLDSRTPIREDQLHADLYIVDTRERVPRKLVTGTEEASMPSWSHDGKWIYFIGGGRSGGERIYRVSPEGGHAMAVSSARGHFPLESFDGQSVYFEVPPGLLQVAQSYRYGVSGRGNASSLPLHELDRRASRYLLLSRRVIESSRLMERAMGIEPTSEAWEDCCFKLQIKYRGD
jgi:WD40-like Beta Propeller Repeat